MARARSKELNKPLLRDLEREKRGAKRVQPDSENSDTPKVNSDTPKVKTTVKRRVPRKMSEGILAQLRAERTATMEPKLPEPPTDDDVFGGLVNNRDLMAAEPFYQRHVFSKCEEAEIL